AGSEGVVGRQRGSRVRKVRQREEVTEGAGHGPVLQLTDRGPENPGRTIATAIPAGEKHSITSLKERNKQRAFPATRVAPGWRNKGHPCTCKRSRREAR